MGTFVVTYMIVWTAVCLYVAQLGRNHDKLQRDLEQVRAQLAQRQRDEDGKLRAA